MRSQAGEDMDAWVTGMSLCGGLEEIQKVGRLLYS